MATNKNAAAKKAVAEKAKPKKSDAKSTNKHQTQDKNAADKTRKPSGKGNADDRMVSNPFSTDERDTLFKLSKHTKEKDLLIGQYRKILYDAGRYEEWYQSRVVKIAQILQQYQKEEDEEDPDSEALLKATEGLLKTLLVGQSSLDVAKFIHLEKAGLATDEELLELATLLEVQGQRQDALRVARKLLAKHTENGNIASLVQRLQQ